MQREERPGVSASAAQKTPKTRSRITAACVRCQKRKIRCDALLPACSACQRAGVQCTGGSSPRDIPRSYVADLEARIRWLESIVQQNVPSIDLGTGPGRSPLLRDRNVPLSSQENDDTSDVDSLRKIPDQIGLISITSGTDLRYLGPSSGLFFTKFVLTGLGTRLQLDKATDSYPANDGAFVPPDLLVPQPQNLPLDQKHTRWLSQAYFDIVHLQFPFLHEPTYWETIAHIYDDVGVSPVLEFQVFMVLALGATILSRRTKVMLSAEGYYASAMKLIDGVNKTPSLSVVQCILLLQMYALNNPTSGLSLWLVHHHGLALAIELGIHRNAPLNSHNHFESELRTRVFWCVYTIDRLLSTLMGRPMGVVDEQCDLRLPADVEDAALRLEEPMLRQSDLPTNMTSAIHLFKFARLNSEVKCVLYCVDRQYPPYTQPAITDARSWKVDILNRLRQWREDIPHHPEGSARYHINLLCDIKYHELSMLVLRPNPRFQHPDKGSLRECFSSAIACSKLYHQLYATNSLHYGWISLHSLFLCVMVMFYCVCTPSGIADEANFESLMRALKVSSDVLSAMGEYWPEAKRSRDILDRVSTATIRRLTQHKHGPRSGNPSLDSQANLDIPSTVSPGKNADVDWGNMSFPAESVPSLQFEDVDMTNVSFSSSYGAHGDSFSSADVLSYFLGSGTDMTVFGPYDFGDVGEEGLTNSFDQEFPNPE